MQLGPEDVLVLPRAEFASELDATGVANAVEHLHGRIRRARPEVTRISVEPMVSRPGEQST